MNKNKEILYTLKEKLKYDARTLILDECIEELEKIIENTTVCRKFAIEFYEDILRYNEHRLEFLKTKKKFEFLNLNEKQTKMKLGNAQICSYKYKKKGNNNKNIRCIFITNEKQEKFTIITIFYNIFLAAFVEKNTKDYEKAINIAINRYNNLLKRN